VNTAKLTTISHTIHQACQRPHIYMYPELYCTSVVVPIGTLLQAQLSTVPTATQFSK